ncbi:hypothetical protein COMX_10008 [Commensalibacter papalotli (ex Servin-Garciduenas et al. 2014)]|uniref:Uncharacterized protein n=1 Tax=Commensalibacter papalotli (ex Servin-Garciduenas et al. 2014) TaxID=1208583 RepID=W7E329_9PROT|nr:hypothetical protein COMX_10008 [Commensalibacter papalotli (ex Servin-Garciduenas et al. 2014)]
MINNTHRIGFLYPRNQLKGNWTGNKRDGGTNIEFCASLNIATSYWFEYGDSTDKKDQEKLKEIQQRLYVYSLKQVLRVHNVPFG